MVNIEIDCQMDSALTAGNSILIYKTTNAGGYFGSKGTTCYWGTGGSEDDANTDIICTERVIANLTFSANGRNISGTINGENFTRTGGSGFSSNNITLGHSTLLPGFKVWSLTVKDENNNIIFDGIPCKNSQDIYGLYDIVSNTFKTSDIEDQFTGSSNEIISSKLIELEEDLTNYVQKTDYASSGTAGIIRVGTAVSTYMSSDNRLSATTRTYEDYTSGSAAMFVGKGTLENVITGKNLYSKPNDGIPKTDLTSEVQTSLGKADTAIQSLEGYVTTTDYASLNVGGTVKVNPSYGINTASTGTLIGVTKDYNNYSSASDLSLIDKGTLENVITGKELITNTDYADSDTGGVIKAGASYGTAMASSGHLIASVKTYEDYSSAGNYMLIGKGTLENVITGKGLATKSDIPKVFYGTSATGATTAAKVVVCEEFTEADLVAGTRITVYFTNANTYNGQATLNINGTGAKNIYYNGTTTNARYMWVAGESVEFIYNGTQWATINGGLATTTYYGVTKLATSAGSDSQALALTPRSLYYFANYSIAPYYSTSKTYAVGDKVRYTYYIYECITAIDEPEAWTVAHWQQVDTVQEQIDALESRIAALENLLQNN